MAEANTFNIPAAPQTNYIVCRNFRGVDFATGVTEVDPSRSPDAPNMIADMAGFPQKRPGYKQIFSDSETNRINGLFFYITPQGQEQLVVHAGKKIYAITPDDDGDFAAGTSTVIYNLANDHKSTAFIFNDTFYFLDGANYLQYNGTGTAADVCENAFIPTTVIGTPPAGGGTAFEAVNLLSPWRKNSFAADGTTKVFQLDATGIDDSDITVWIDGTQSTAYTINRTKGQITFNTAPPDSKGVDNVVIQFAKTIAGYADKIKKCTIAAFYGAGNDSRIFVAGNPGEKNIDYQSGLYDPTYFPDTGYTKVGAENSAIMGYLKQYESLIIIKEQSDQDASLYLRTATFDGEGRAMFPIKQGIAGVGAISSYAFGNLADDAMFLSKDGVYGLDSNAVTQQRTAQMRSYYINPALKSENLQDACVAVWNGYYVLCVGGKAFLANSRQTNQNPTGGFGYEWYYWTNIPARCVIEHDGDLYFGSINGKVYKLRNPNEEGSLAYSDDGAAIDAQWSTPFFDGGDFMRLKNISKKGTGILAKPFSRSGGTIYYATERDFEKRVKSFSIDIFDFNDIDFDRFTFNTLDRPTVQATNTKERKVSMFQLIIRNNTINEAFGLFGIQIAYTLAAFKK